MQLFIVNDDSSVRKHTSNQCFSKGNNKVNLISYREKELYNKYYMYNTNPTVSSTAANINNVDTPTAIPTIAPVGRLSDSWLSAETVKVGLGGISLCELVSDGKWMAVVIDGRGVKIDCTLIFTIVMMMM